MGGGGGMGSAKGGGQVSTKWQDPEQFLVNNSIEEHGAQSFRQLPEAQQQLVMSAGSLGGSRDPTAVLISRMAKAKRGNLQPQMAQNPGDWFCSGCNDLQFARNMKCRNCGTEKPIPKEYGDIPAAEQREVE